MKMNRFEVISGNHHDGEKVFPKGSTIDSVSDLCEIFPGRFRLVGPVTAASLPVVVSTPAPEVRGTPVKKQPKAVASDLGENVTVDFDDASDKGLLVFKTPSGKYQVSHDSEPDVALTPKPLSRLRLIGFLDEYVS